MKKLIWRLLIAAASCGSLMSGFFWLLSAKVQRELMDVSVSHQEAAKALLVVSADMNYWAALGACFTGAALLLSAVFET